MSKAWGLRIAWLALAVVLLGVAIFAGWQLYGSNQLGLQQAQTRLDEYAESCSISAQEQFDEGEVIATLQLPTLSQQRWPVVAGVQHAQLSGGVGWYPTTAAPGAIGNTVLAGYRLTNGQPFADLLALNVGDEVIVQTCVRSYHYEIVVAPRDLVVDEAAGWILDAVPGQPGQLPTAKMLTLTTSQDKLPTTDRAVGFAKLVREAAR